MALRTSSRSHWKALGIGTVLALTILLVFLENRAVLARGTVRLVQADEALALEFLEEYRAGPGSPEAWGDYPHHMPQPVVGALGWLRGSRRKYDPWCYAVYKRFKFTRSWSEHPDGAIHRRIDDLGLHRVRPLRKARPPVRVLVAGDSHVVGICHTEETFPARLEVELEGECGPGQAEVMNAAFGGYSLYHYRGLLERFHHLGFRPDVFLVTVYGGNDLTSTLRTRYLLRGEPSPWSGHKLGMKLILEHEEYRGPWAQALSAVESLRCRPLLAEPCVASSLELLEEMSERCDELGMRFVVVYLPSPLELPGHADQARLRRTQELLGLEAEHLAAYAGVCERLRDGVRAAGWRFVDLLEAFGQVEAGTLLYWSEDMHLNVRGHELAAAAVLPELRDALSRAPSQR